MAAAVIPRLAFGSGPPAAAATPPASSLKFPTTPGDFYGQRAAALKPVIKKQTALHAPHAAHPHKHVQFQPQVVVVLINGQGHLVGTTRQDLQFAAAASPSPPSPSARGVVRRSTSYQQAVYDDGDVVDAPEPTASSSTPGCSPFRSNAVTDAASAGAGAAAAAASVAGTAPSLPVGHYNMSFVKPRGGGVEETRVKFQLHLGPGFQSSDVVVKAHTNGSHIRVVGARSSADEPPLGINEKFVLPVAVDPYSLVAKLDAKGLLVVEARIRPSSAADSPRLAG